MEKPWIKIHGKSNRPFSSGWIENYTFCIAGKIVEVVDHNATVERNAETGETTITLKDLPFNMEHTCVILEDIFFNSEMVFEDFFFEVSGITTNIELAATAVRDYQLNKYWKPKEEPDMANHNIIIRGHSEFCMYSGMFLSFRFFSGHAEFVEYDTRRQKDVKVSYDSVTGLFEITLYDVPFYTYHEDISLSEIFFDEEQISVDNFCFVITEIVCDDETAHMSIKPATDHCYYWMTEKEWEKKQGIKHDEKEDEEYHFYFFIRTDLSDEFLQGLKHLHFVDTFANDNKYRLDINHIDIEKWDETADGKLLNCYGKLWHDSDHGSYVDPSFIHGDQTFLKIKDITIFNGKGEVVCEDDSPGFIDIDEVRFEWTTIPWYYDKMEECEDGTIYVSINVGGDHEEFINSISEILLVDHDKKYHFSMSSAKVLYDAPMALIMQIKGKLYDSTFMAVDNSYIADDDSKFRYIAFTLNGNPGYYSIRRMDYITGRKANHVCIPPDETVIVDYKQEGLVLDLITNLPNISIVAGMDHLSCLTTKTNWRFQIVFKEATVLERNGNHVKIKITKYDKKVITPNVVLTPGILNLVDKYMCYGFHVHPDYTDMLLVGITYDGCKVTMIGTDEHGVLGPTKTNINGPSTYNYPTLSLVALVKNADGTPLELIESFVVQVGGFEYTATALTHSILSEHIEDDTHYRILIDIIPGEVFDSDGTHTLIDFLKGPNTCLKKVIFKEKLCDDIDIKFIKAYVAGHEIEIDKQIVSVMPEKPQESSVTNRKITIGFKITESGRHEGCYQVREVSVEEVRSGKLLEVKDCDCPINGNHNNHVEISNKDTEVCSELVVAKGADIDYVQVLDGGYVTIEEGGHVGRLYVHSGGIAELCHEAQVDWAYECGGAVYGVTRNTKFGGMTLYDGRHPGGKYMTVHKGTVLRDTDIIGKLDVHDNTYTTGLEVYGELNVHGGYHDEITVEEGGTLYADGGTLMSVTSHKGSRVVIIGDVTLINCEFHGDVSYTGDFVKDLNIVNCKSEQVVEHFNLGDYLVDDLEDPTDKE